LDSGFELRATTRCFADAGLPVPAWAHRHRGCAWLLVGLLAEAKLIVVRIQDRELADTPRPCLDGLCDPACPLVRLLVVGGYYAEPASKPFGVKRVNRRSVNVDSGVVRERVKLRCGAQMETQPLTASEAVARVLGVRAKAQPPVKREREVEVAHREYGRRTTQRGDGRRLFSVCVHGSDHIARPIGPATRETPSPER
jgi:hypothetical protein